MSCPQNRSDAEATGSKRSAVPPVSAWLQSGFHRFLRPYLRRHFDGIALHQESYAASDLPLGQPAIIYCNHPSWWDPLIAHYLNAELFSPRQFYAPIDAAALQHYRVFAKLGFYGIDLTSTSGTADFLRTSLAILDSDSTALWITPEGRFSDVRDSGASLMPGLAHLCTKLQSGAVIPTALEYTFWEERLPLCVVLLGQPLDPAACRQWDKRRWNEVLSDRLRQTQQQLASSVIAREAAAFRPLLRGRAGAGGIYDAMRRLRCWASGKRFRPEHGEKLR